MPNFGRPKTYQSLVFALKAILKRERERERERDKETERIHLRCQRWNETERNREKFNLLIARRDLEAFVRPTGEIIKSILMVHKHKSFRGEKQANVQRTV